MTTKVNPTKANTVDHFNGKTVTAITVDLAVDGTDFSSTEMGALGAVQEAILTLSNQATPIIMTKLRSDGSNAGQVFDVIYEGEFGTDTYDGSTSESFADYLQSELRLLTTAGIRTAAQIADSGESANAAGLDLSSATVVAGTAVNFS
jgi:hypothetical protein